MLLLPLAGPLSAHHGTSQYAMEREVVLAGTVKEWRWASPHTWLYLEVPVTGGAVEQWSIESAPPAYMARQGWSEATFKAGERLSVTIALLRSGERAGILLEVARGTGEVLVVRPRGQFGRRP